MDNFRFSTLEYKRPDLDAYRAKLKDWKAAIEHAESYEALRTLLLEMDRENCELSTQYSIANIRHTLNTRDEFYETEVAYLDDTLPTLGGEEVALSEAIASSPFRPDIEKEFGKQYFVSMDLQKKHVFFEQLEKEAWDMRRLLAGKAQIKIAAIGSATAAALKEHGLFADIVPKIYNAGELGKTLAENISEYSAVTIFRAEEGSLELLPPLMETGVPVNDIALYRTEYEVSSLLRHKIEKMFQKEEIDAVTFTSASTVKGFVKAIKNVELQNVSAVCIGEQTAAEARKYGMKIQVAKRADMDAMTEKIVECFGNVNF